MRCARNNIYILQYTEHAGPTTSIENFVEKSNKNFVFGSIAVVWALAQQPYYAYRSTELAGTALNKVK